MAGAVMDWASIAKELTSLGLPLIGTALLGPAGATIGTALANSLQTADKTPAGVLNALKTSADELNTARQFEEKRGDALLQFAVNAETADRANARDLAGKDIAGGNAFTSFLAAAVRPAFGFAALGMIVHSGMTNIDLPAHVAPIIDDVVQFYFGARVIEKIMPHVSQAISNFAGNK